MSKYTQGWKHTPHVVLKADQQTPVSWVKVVSFVFWTVALFWAVGQLSTVAFGYNALRVIP